MDIFSVGLVLAEFVGIILLGLLLGKAIHLGLKAAAILLVNRTHVVRDEHILAAVEGSLQAISIVWLFYVVSGRLEGMAPINTIINAYSYSILILLAAYSVSEFVNAFLKWHYNAENRHKVRFDESIIPFFRKVARVLILGSGLFLALKGLGVDLSGLLTATGVLAIILGLAAQETLANIFAGLALQWDRPFLYGDDVEFPDGLRATLVSIGLRSSRLVDEKGNEIILSNSQFAQARIKKLKKQRNAQT